MHLHLWSPGGSGCSLSTSSNSTTTWRRSPPTISRTAAWSPAAAWWRGRTATRSWTGGTSASASWSARNDTTTSAAPWRTNTVTMSMGGGEGQREGGKLHNHGVWDAPSQFPKMFIQPRCYNETGQGGQGQNFGPLLRFAFCFIITPKVGQTFGCNYVGLCKERTFQ